MPRREHLFHKKSITSGELDVVAGAESGKVKPEGAEPFSRQVKFCLDQLSESRKTKQKGKQYHSI